MKKLLIFVLCFAILGGGGFFGYKQYEKNKEENTVVDVVSVSMMAQPARYFDYSSSDMQGRITASNAQKVYVDTNKLVQNVLVEKGQEVKKGDVLLEYDMTVVELELAQKENNVKLTEQNIKMANKKLIEYQNLKPSEDAPQYDEPEPDNYDDEPDFPDFPDIEPIEPVTEVSSVTPPVSGTGTAEDPFVINCMTETVVRKPFLMSIAAGKRVCELRVYHPETLNFLYKWIIDGSKLDAETAEDFPVMDGLTLDKKTGSVSVNPDAKMHGQLSFTAPQPEMPEDYGMHDEDMFENMPEPEYQPQDTFDPDNEDYMYSRRQLAQMVREQKSEIKRLELELKNAQLAYESAKKQKSDGKVVAEIDGIVKKIGKAAGEDSEEDAFSEENMYGGDNGDDNAFAVIEGAGGVEVAFEVAELVLPDVPVGARVDVQSYMNGAFSSATVTSVSKEPISYSTNDPWSNNPQNSSYLVHAILDDSEDFVIGNYVSVSLQKKSSGSGNGAVFMPIYYVRPEDGDYYIMKQGEDGRLVKQYVRAGRVMWGEMIEITGGLSMDDKICFPYGTDVKEGVRTNETSEVLYPSMYY